VSSNLTSGTTFAPFVPAQLADEARSIIAAGLVVRRRDVSVSANLETGRRSQSRGEIVMSDLEESRKVFLARQADAEAALVRGDVEPRLAPLVEA
jgi:hypothetical protein